MTATCPTAGCSGRASLWPPVSERPQAKAKLPAAPAPSPHPKHLCSAQGNSPASSERGLCSERRQTASTLVCSSPKQLMGSLGTSTAVGRLRTVGCMEGERAMGTGHCRGHRPLPNHFTAARGSRIWPEPGAPLHLLCLVTAALMWQSRPIRNTPRFSSPTQITTAGDRTDPSFSRTKTWRDKS